MAYSEKLGYHTRVQARNELGRFVRLMDETAIAVTADLVDRGVELAKQNARPFRKTGALEAGIEGDRRGKVGYIRSTAPHAHPVEKGQVPHDISNSRTGKRVQHPGAQPQPYLEPVGAQLQREAQGIAQRRGA